MAIRPVLRMGHPLLQQVAAPVERFGTAELRELVADLPTMRALNGAGIAAPQIGVSLARSVVRGDAEPALPARRIRAVHGPRQSRATPTATSATRTGRGCLSVPGLRGVVPAPPQASLSRVRRAGPADRPHRAGFHARVVQHEVDHLDGILFPKRIDGPACARLRRRAVPGSSRRSRRRVVLAAAAAAARIGAGTSHSVLMRRGRRRCLSVSQGSLAMTRIPRESSPVCASRPCRCWLDAATAHPATLQGAMSENELQRPTSVRASRTSRSPTWSAMARCRSRLEDCVHSSCLLRVRTARIMRRLRHGLRCRSIPPA